jgi:ABC-type polysaccharide/polyol phosphate export permease
MLEKLVDVLMNVALIAMLVSVIGFFITKKPKFGFAAAILLAAIPVVQIIGMFFAPAINPETEKARMLALPLIYLFDGLCLICAGVMYRVAKQREDRM